MRGDVITGKLNDIEPGLPFLAAGIKGRTLGRTTTGWEDMLVH